MSAEPHNHQPPTELPPNGENSVQQDFDFNEFFGDDANYFDPSQFNGDANIDFDQFLDANWNQFQANDAAEPPVDAQWATDPNEQMQQYMNDSFPAGELLMSPEERAELEAMMLGIVPQAGMYQDQNTVPMPFHREASSRTRALVPRFTAAEAAFILYGTNIDFALADTSIVETPVLDQSPPEPTLDTPPSRQKRARDETLHEQDQTPASSPINSTPQSNKRARLAKPQHLEQAPSPPTTEETTSPKFAAPDINPLQTLAEAADLVSSDVNGTAMSLENQATRPQQTVTDMARIAEQPDAALPNTAEPAGQAGVANHDLERNVQQVPTTSGRAATFIATYRPAVIAQMTSEPYRRSPHGSNLPSNVLSRIVCYMLEPEPQRFRSESTVAYTRDSIARLHEFRLCSKNCRTAAWEALGRAIRNVTFSLTPVSLMHLRALSENDDIRGHISMLKFCDLFFPDVNGRDFDNIWRQKIAAPLNNFAKMNGRTTATAMMKLSPVLRDCFRKLWDRQELYRRGGSIPLHLTDVFERMPALDSINIVSGDLDRSETEISAIDLRMIWADVLDAFLETHKTKILAEEGMMAHIRFVLQGLMVSDTNLLVQSLGAAAKSKSKRITHLTVSTKPGDRGTATGLFHFGLKWPVVNLVSHLKRLSLQVSYNGAIHTSNWPNSIYAMLRQANNITSLDLYCYEVHSQVRINLDNLYIFDLQSNDFMLPKLHDLRLCGVRTSAATLMLMLHPNVRSAVLREVEITPASSPSLHGSHQSERDAVFKKYWDSAKKNPMAIADTEAFNGRIKPARTSDDTWDAVIKRLVSRMQRRSLYLTSLNIEYPTQTPIVPPDRSTVLDIHALNQLGRGLAEMGIVVGQHRDWLYRNGEMIMDAGNQLWGRKEKFECWNFKGGLMVDTKNWTRNVKMGRHGELL